MSSCDSEVASIEGRQIPFSAKASSKLLKKLALKSSFKTPLSSPTDIGKTLSATVL